ncbi:MAG: 7-cyano-7-deazaguanine synthase QueC [Gammaproteobacteria bacterium]|nr:7-cyano-7-deazaguanine synthase QueC [Gammaproteobacteria bacterium]
MTEHPIAVVLFSGGLDSTTLLHIAREQGFAVHAMSFRYGQRHAVELDRARDIMQSLGLPHVVFDLNLRQFGGSALTDDIEVPKGRSPEQMDGSIPVTYVPARNTVFLALALAYAESRGAHDIFIGVNALDYSGYPDCRPEFIAAFQQMARLATKAGVEGQQINIHTPLIDLTKAQIIERGLALGVDYALTVSCYDPDPDGLACGHCDACALRRKGFADAGVADPTRYVER